MPHEAALSLSMDWSLCWQYREMYIIHGTGAMSLHVRSQSGVCYVQEFLIEELARRAFDITAKSNRDIISYNDIGETFFALIF